MVIEFYTTHGLLDLANCCGSSGYNNELVFERIKKWTNNNLTSVLIDRLSLSTRWTFQTEEDATTFKLRWNDYIFNPE